MTAEPRDLTRDELRQFPLPAYPDAGKTAHGYLVVVAGSRYTPGSALLCSVAAQRTGVGQVTIITVESAAAALSIENPESKVVPVAEGPDGGFGTNATAAIAEHVKTCGGVVGGPGMEPDAAATKIGAALLSLPVPVIIDSGLLYSIPSLEAECSAREGATILLPHTVEMAAILGCTHEEAEQDSLSCARKASARFGAIVLAKGATSYIAAPDGRTWIHRGGVPGLGIAGSGDTLAGMIGALVARGADPLATLLWGVRLHGEAGEVLSAKIGPVGFLAREIPDVIPALLAR